MVHLMTQALWPVTRPVSMWAESSQRHACRNAMVATTAITAVRQERDEAQDYVETLIARRSRRVGAAISHSSAARLG